MIVKAHMLLNEQWLPFFLLSFSIVTYVVLTAWFSFLTVTAIPVFFFSFSSELDLYKHMFFLKLSGKLVEPNC